MKKVFGTKSKIFLLIFLVGSILGIFFAINQSNSQSLCTEEAAISSGYLESPIFDLGTTTDITKFLWKGYVDDYSFVKFTLYGGESSSSLEQSAIIEVRPYEIYIPQEPILRFIRYLKYEIDMYKCNEESIPRVDQIYIYYSY